MRITKRQLRRIIKEEKRRIAEECGGGCDGDMDIPPDVGIAAGPVLESDSPEHDVLVEMVLASRSLELVVESVQNAAHLCPDCGDVVAAQAPVVEAMVSQAEALQEMLDAQVKVIQENTTAESVLSDDHPIVDAIIDVIE